MKIQIRKEVHEQITKLAQANNIAITDLANILLSKMLGNHHKELKDVIQKLRETK